MLVDLEANAVELIVQGAALIREQGRAEIRADRQHESEMLARVERLRETSGRVSLSERELQATGPEFLAMSALSRAIMLHRNFSFSDEPSRGIAIIATNLDSATYEEVLDFAHRVVRHAD